MLVADCDILMLPGWTNSGPEHWQSRWQERLSTAMRVEQADWDHPKRDLWVSRIVAAVGNGSRPAVAIAHSCGVTALVHAAPQLAGTRLRGAFMVAPPGETVLMDTPAIDRAFHPVPRAPLPFPSVLVASRNDPQCPFLEAEEWAYAWGSNFVDAGDAGHLNTASGHGPWPEGLMRFAGFMAKL